MIYTSAIIATSGVVLWIDVVNQTNLKIFIPILNEFVETVIIEEKAGDDTKMISNYQLQWLKINVLEIFFLSIYVDEPYYKVNSLLAKLRLAFESVVPLDEITSLPSTTLRQTELTKIFLQGKSTELSSIYWSILNKLDHVHDSKEVSIDSSKRVDDEGTKTKEIKEKQIKKTNWPIQRITRQAMNALDFSTEKFDSNTNQHNNYASDSEEEEEEEVKAKKPSFSLMPNFMNKLNNIIGNIKGNQMLNETNLAPALDEFNNLLVSKNVAAEVAEQLTKSVKSFLIDTKTESFTSIRSAFEKALTGAISRVLEQNRNINVLKSALEAKMKHQVFTICFLGINGVGKSTTLAKVAYYLKKKGNHNVLVAACDTFRAGAVEQLKTHTKNLKLQLYQEGYGKDASIICKNAIKYAQSNNLDTVLIDTAGRMQDNEPLMRSLADLVANNNIDLVFFVGEALVGNDAIDQLKKFNSSLIGFATAKSKQPRGIDGIILTKVDTVDEKIGAALSMSYISGLPIVFVGTGQKYTHLQPFDANIIVNALMHG